MSKPIEIVLEALRKNGKKVTQRREKWMACCPAHEDRNPSLSIRECDDQKVLMHCFAGCSVDEICHYLALELSDLWPTQSADVNKTYCHPKHMEPKGPPYDSVEDALDDLDKRMKNQFESTSSSLWEYFDEKGELVAVVVRYDLPTKEGQKQQKTFRPISLYESSWYHQGLKSLWPLYRLNDLGNEDPICIFEGEKAADAAANLGFHATTSAHGAGSASKTDWLPLSGREVIIFPDNDTPGEDYSDSVVTVLNKLDSPPVIKVVNLPDLEEHEDIVDFIEKRSKYKSKDEILSEIKTLIEDAELVKPLVKKKTFLQYEPFPVDILPDPIRRFIKESSKALVCDPALIALPLLSAIASAIGNTRRIQIKETWTEPSILWTAIVAESGSMKSPALHQALKFIRKIEKKEWQKLKSLEKEYENKILIYKEQLKYWKKNLPNHEPPNRPEEPIATRLSCGDATIEAIAAILSNQPKGVLLIRDELSGWLNSFDKYSGGSGSDVAIWLEMFGGRAISIDRKTSTPPYLYIEKAAVSITGGIQPNVLQRSLGREHHENGLAARILLAYPPKKIKYWIDHAINVPVDFAMEMLFNRLYELDFDDSGYEEQRPIDLPLSIEAKSLWVEFYNQHARELHELSGDMAAVWSKLEGYAARFALVIHMIRLVNTTDKSVKADCIDEESIRVGIKLSEWFKNESLRIHQLFDEDDEEKETREILKKIEKNGGTITVRELQRSSRKYNKSNDARKALNKLEEAGLGTWGPSHTTRKGGAPSKSFVLKSN